MNSRISSRNRCVFVAPFLPENPYQPLLAAAIERKGWQVVGSRRSWFVGEFLGSKAKLLHLHWLHPFFARRTVLRSLVAAALFLLQLSILKARRVPIVWTAHNLAAHEQRYPSIDKFITRLVVLLSNRVLAHCDWAKAELCRHFSGLSEDVVDVTPHASYIGAYPNEVDRVEARRRLQFPNDATVFLFLGAVRPYKGVDELIDAFRKASFDESVVLMIAGKAWTKDLAAAVRQQAGDVQGVRLFLDFVADGEVQYYMHAADAVVFPYKNIFTSGAALLAMSFGKTIIAPKIGCMSDLLRDAGAFLYDRDDETGLFSALRDAVASREQLGSLGDRNLKIAEQLTWERMGGQTVSGYERCLR